LGLLSGRLGSQSSLAGSDFVVDRGPGCGDGQRSGGSFIANYLGAGGQFIGVFYPDSNGLFNPGRKHGNVLAQYNVLWWAVLGQILLAGLLIRTGVAHFNREELLGRELDTINFKAGWQVFYEAFVGQARSPLEWYRNELGRTLRRLLIPIVCMLLALGLAVWPGQARRRYLSCLPPP